MPLSAYFGGSGSSVMTAMVQEYGKQKGERIFYATANKQKAAKKRARGKRSLLQAGR